MEFNKICLLKGFFNYFNRRIYFYESLKDYTDIAEAHEIKEDINFNPNDGVSTSLVIATSSISNHCDFSYLLVLDEENKIISRWFITDARRNLTAQFTLSLKRDVVAEAILSKQFKEEAPIYVEKGMLSEEDPLIVNSEGISFNQIKKSEKLLKDPSGWGYIVGYMANSASLGETTITGSTRVPSSFYTIAQIAQATGISATDITRMLDGGEGATISIATGYVDIDFGVDVFPLTAINHIHAYIRVPNSLSGEMNLYGGLSALRWDYAVGVTDKLFASEELPLMVRAIENDYNAFRAELDTVLNSLFPNDKFYNLNNLERLEFFRGKIVYYDGNYYNIEISSGNVESHPEVIISDGMNAYFDSLVSTMNLRQYYDNWRLYLNYERKSISIRLTPVDSVALKYQISASHNVLEDAPYSMFVIPYGDTVALRAMGNVPYLPEELMPKEDAIRVACSIAEHLDANLYDLQLLPFMPEYNEWITEWTGGDYTGQFIFLNDKTKDIDYNDIVTGDGDQAGIIMYMKKSNFSFQIPETITLQDEIKIESQCNFYRLCSPNYNGVFEFNLAKNGGKVSYFLVDCTYKPINPFIRVTPEFQFLYGQNFLDGRGLICGGDFSLPVIKDAWINYELNNKNYGTIFARDIQNLDFSQRQERFKEPFEIGAGIVGAGAAGGVAGSKAGPYGAIAGAAVGAGAGIVGGMLDAKLAEQRRVEAKDYAFDRFNLSLANVKALPDSLAKNSAFNIVNKIFPFLEYYSCTDIEKEALRSKIKYDGMTVGRIDYINNFMGGNDNQKYFKGQLIWALGIFDNEDFIEALYNEIAKGVYI